MDRFDFLDIKFQHTSIPMHALRPLNPVDGDGVPVRHFGCVLTMDAWTSLRDRLVERNTTFLIEPKIRFVGEVGEQATLFITDPSGNGLEFKAFQDNQALFARSDD